MNWTWAIRTCDRHGDHSWWRWEVEFSNHTGRSADWAPPGQQLKR